ncbi:hypothetical protein ACWDV7_00340 [Streptomyces sp. NPDC003362]
MTRRIARLVAALRRPLRRPTVQHTGSQPPQAEHPATVLGVGLGSLGMPVVKVRGGK